MPRVSATRRASYTSSIEQQRPWTDSGMPSCPARRRWFQSCIVRPMTLRPSARSMAATTEESTPPDMATAMAEASRTLILKPNLPYTRRMNFYFLLLSNYRRMGGVGLLHSHTSRTHGQHFVIGHKKDPIMIAFVRTFEIIGGRNR